MWFLLFLQSDDNFECDWKRRDFVASCRGFVPTACKPVTSSVWSLCPRCLHSLALVASCDLINDHRLQWLSTESFSGFRGSFWLIYAWATVLGGQKDTRKAQGLGPEALGPWLGSTSVSQLFCGFAPPLLRAVPFSPPSPQRESDWLRHQQLSMPGPLTGY